MVRERLEDYVRTIPDFPEPGIMFRDITTVLSDADGLKLAIDEMAKKLENVDFDVIAGAESRGFIFGAALAYDQLVVAHDDEELLVGVQAQVVVADAEPQSLFDAIGRGLGNHIETARRLAAERTFLVNHGFSDK